jgi:hypothetical protein
MEYNWFYLMAPSVNFRLRVSAVAAGDATDAVNRYTGPTANGSPFAVSTWCAATYGPFWYSVPDGQCTVFSLFGSFNWLGIGNLKAARMMMRITQ